MKKASIGFLIGLMIAFSGTIVAQEINQYILSKTSYDIYVDGTIYNSEALPVLNYEGATYVPLRAMGDLLHVPVLWNQELRRVVIGTASEDKPIQTPDEEGPIFQKIKEENEVFRNLRLTGSSGDYTIVGEVNSSNEMIYYSVSDGHFYLAEGQQEVETNADGWTVFTLQLELSEEALPHNGTLMLELFDGLDEDGFRTNMLFVLLEHFVPVP